MKEAGNPITGLVILSVLLLVFTFARVAYIQSMDCEKFREVKASDIPAKCLAYWQPVQPQQQPSR